MHDPNYFYELQVDNFLEVQKELNSIIDQIDFPDQNILRFYRLTDDVNPFKENKLLREFTNKNKYTMQISCSEIEWNHMLAEEFFIL